MTSVEAHRLEETLWYSLGVGCGYTQFGCGYTQFAHFECFFGEHDLSVVQREVLYWFLRENDEGLGGIDG